MDIKDALMIARLPKANYGVYICTDVKNNKWSIVPLNDCYVYVDGKKIKLKEAFQNLIDDNTKLKDAIKLLQASNNEKILALDNKINKLEILIKNNNGGGNL